MISARTKALIWLSALPLFVALAVGIFMLVIPVFFSGWGIDVPVFYPGSIAALLILWLCIVVSAVTSFRRDRRPKITS